METTRAAFRVCAIAAVLGVSSGCTSLDYPLLRDHVIPTDANGRIVEVETGRALAVAEVDALLARLLDIADAECDAKERAGRRRELLIHVHGGLNSSRASLSTAQAALERMRRDPHAPHAIFVTWPSGAWSTYTDHLLAVRQGQRYPPLIGWPTAPIIAATDFLGSIALAPKTLLYQWLVDARVAGKVAFDWNLDRAAADEQPLAQAADAAGYRVRRGTYARGFARQLWRFVSYWITQPSKIVFQVFALNGMGQGAWDVMLHRTRHLFHGPDEFGLSGEERGDPAAVAAHVEGKKERLHAFFEALKRRTCVGESGGPCWDITLVGHSMGAIVLNEALATYPELPVKNIVYMAPACSVRDVQKVIVPYLQRHERTRFFLLMLHPVAEADEQFEWLPGLDLLPRGSLLEWIDNWYTTPPSWIDRTLGKWLNVIPAVWLFAAVRDRVYLKSFDVGDGAQPERHGDFNEFAFWRPEFWWDQGIGR